MTYIDCDELAVRIGEACMGNRRPHGFTASEALRSIERLNPDAAYSFMRAARSAAEYIAGCCNADNPGSVEVKSVLVGDGAVS